MALTKTFDTATTGAGITGNATSEVVLIHYEGTWEGNIVVQLQASNSNDWQDIESTRRLKNCEPFSMQVPNVAVDYRFYCYSLTSGECNAYMGP